MSKQLQSSNNFKSYGNWTFRTNGEWKPGFLDFRFTLIRVNGEQEMAPVQNKFVTYKTPLKEIFDHLSPLFAVTKIKELRIKTQKGELLLPGTWFEKLYKNEKSVVWHLFEAGVSGYKRLHDENEITTKSNATAKQDVIKPIINVAESEYGRHIKYGRSIYILEGTPDAPVIRNKKKGNIISNDTPVARTVLKIWKESQIPPK